jgi:O-antigen/teichoic acid export membrane protein
LKLKSSVTFSYAAQLYAAVATLIVTPLYIEILGAEGFGLIGFFLMLQAWSQVLDAGMSGSVTRLVSASRLDRTLFSKAMSRFTKVLHLFLAISLLIICFGSFFKTQISTSWLSSSIDVPILTKSIFGIFLCLGLKYMSGPFRGALVGLERHGIVSFVSVLVISLKFPVSLIYLQFVSADIDKFFMYQAVISILEIFMYALFFQIVKTRELNALRLSPHSEGNDELNLSFGDFIKMSGLLSILSVCWVIVSQIDKLTLSKYLPLEEYGHYSIAVTLSGSILLLAAPLNQILMPMMTGLVAKNHLRKLQDVFYFSLVAITVTSFPLALFFYFFGTETLLFWTGNNDLAQKSSGYLGFLALGNSIGICMSLIFLILFAFGDLVKHTKVYLVYSLFLVPVTVFVASNFGGLGSSLLWFIHNLLFFCFWGFTVINKFFKGSIWFLISKLFIPVIILSSLHFWLVSLYFPLEFGRLTLGLLLVCVGVSNVMCCCAYLFFGNVIKKTRSLPTMIYRSATL